MVVGQDADVLFRLVVNFSRLKNGIGRGTFAMREVTDAMNALAHGRPAHHPELSRPYFEREIRCGHRVVFVWNPAHRWPDHRPGLYEDKDIIEGVVFMTPEAAARFDLEQTDGDAPENWSGFANWEDAAMWVFEADGA